MTKISVPTDTLVRKVDEFIKKADREHGEAMLRYHKDLSAARNLLVDSLHELATEIREAPIPNEDDDDFNWASEHGLQVRSSGDVFIKTDIIFPTKPRLPNNYYDAKRLLSALQASTKDTYSIDHNDSLWRYLYEPVEK